MKELVIVVACAKNGVIGVKNGLPWHVPEDLAHFRKVTSGGCVVMGSNTWLSLPERYRPLPGRRNVVLSSDKSFSAHGAEVVSSLEDVLSLDVDKVFVIGGAMVYRSLLPYATRIEMTELDICPKGDAFFEFSRESWSAESVESGVSVSGIGYRFLSLVKF